MSKPQKPFTEVFILWDDYDYEQYIDSLYATLESAQQAVPDAKWRYRETEEAWTTKVRKAVPNNQTVMHAYKITREEVQRS